MNCGGGGFQVPCLDLLTVLPDVEEFWRGQVVFFPNGGEVY